MKEQFYDYLVKRGYSVTTPTGKPSTVFAYSNCIDKICEWENTTWARLARNIGTVVALYDVGGVKEDYGKLSHSAVINALKRFSEFIESQR